MKDHNIILTTFDQFFDNAEKRLDEIAQSKHKKIDKKTVIAFSDIDTLSKVLSMKRLAVLSAIKKAAPGSMYELAVMLNRDQASVFKDCKKLYHAGFITLKKLKKDGRTVLVPRLVFDYDRIVMPMGIYNLMHFDLPHAA